MPAYRILAAIEVVQPLGVFYITKLDAATLLEITYVDPLRVTSEAFSDEEYPLTGAQRIENKKRLKAIAEFIESTEATFPNSIIIGANYTKDGVLVEDTEELEERWRIKLNGNKQNGCLELVIPTNKRLASVIDGQHRLNAFLYADKSKLTTELLCAVFLDLPNPYQASIFATINFNQKKVDRSLAYLLFGMTLEDEKAEAWAPDKTAVFLSRKLNLDADSPFYQHIIVAAQNDDILFKNKKKNKEWAVSTATVVDGTLKLFSQKPQSDKDRLFKHPIGGGRERKILGQDPLYKDSSPLRNLYLHSNDLGIYTIIKNYFTAVEELFWKKFPVLTKTVAIQALFDVLRLLLERMKQEDQREFTVKIFRDWLKPALAVQFDELFQSSSIGRSNFRNFIGLSTHLIELPELKKNRDIDRYINFAFEIGLSGTKEFKRALDDERKKLGLA